MGFLKGAVKAGGGVTVVGGAVYSVFDAQESMNLAATESSSRWDDGGHLIANAAHAVGSLITNASIESMSLQELYAGRSLGYLGLAAAGGFVFYKMK